MKKRELKPLKVKIKNSTPDTLAGTRLYLFDGNGNLIEHASLKNGVAELKTAAEVVQGSSQLIIGPEIPAELQGRALDPLLIRKMGGYQPSIHIDANNELFIYNLPVFPYPFFNRCLISGNLTKVFSIDGQSKTLPICDARVHIEEVDRVRWWWWRIPHVIIDDLADKLKHMILYPVKPFPPIGPDPGPLVTNVLYQKSAMLRTKALPQAELKSAPAAPSLLPESVQSGLFSDSKTVVRDTIYNNFQLLHPFLCKWPIFWPYFYITHKIATVYSDVNGHFDCQYINLTNDKDIYIWVEVCIDGNWVTVYRPPIPCNTHWDYDCGTDININITDSRVKPCGRTSNVKGEIVWFRTIGEWATAQQIEQNDASSVAVQGVPFPNVGCTNTFKDYLGNNFGISPFGSTLYFKLIFGDGFPSSGITHYRWRKTNLKDAALIDVPFPGTTVVNGMVQKYYFVITTDGLGHMHFETKAVTLGAEGTGENIGYRIPHWDIYQDPGVPAADKLLTIQWTSPDFWSAAIDSTTLADGLWRFDLELLKPNGSGVFQVVEVPKQVFQVTDLGSFGKSVDAPDAYLQIDAVQITKAFHLQVKVRIENGHCTADVQDASITVNGVTEYSGKCGFLHYTDLKQNVHLSFIAAQARNFAAYSFSVVKGNNTDPITPTVSQAGYVNASSLLYTLSGGVFGTNAPVDQLLGDCTQAAYAENLYVWSLVTNGTRFLYEYDASDTNAFALSNT
ncbi:MAG: hypothetical protein NTW10_13905 [Bacteroidetes bacterium]|nr:hypothetical protein [Bacteroidota bacterium]